MNYIMNSRWRLYLVHISLITDYCNIHRSGICLWVCLIQFIIMWCNLTYLTFNRVPFDTFGYNGWFFGSTLVFHNHLHRFSNASFYWQNNFLISNFQFLYHTKSTQISSTICNSSIHIFPKKLKIRFLRKRISSIARSAT